MSFNKIRSYAKINLALNIVGKTSHLHKIESLITFVSLHDEILIKKTKTSNHKISFFGRFSKGIGKENSISKLLKILDKRKLIQNKKFIIKIKKKIPIQAGLGGGSMNAASVLKYLLKKEKIKVTRKEIIKICGSVGSDVILGMRLGNLILTSKNKVRYFKKKQKFHVLVVKPNFGCATKEIYSRVKNFCKTEFNRPNRRMFGINFLKEKRNQLEEVSFVKYPKLKLIKSYLENINNPIFVRMTGSGSALIAYYQSKEKTENAKKMFKKKYKNYWCISSKTI